MCGANPTMFETTEVFARKCKKPAPFRYNFKLNTIPFKQPSMKLLTVCGVCSCMVAF